MSRHSSVALAPSLVRRDRDTANLVVRELQEGGYCALLGPRYSGKTEVIRTVRELVRDRWRSPCVYVDLYEVEASTQREFFAALAALAVEQLAALGGDVGGVPTTGIPTAGSVGAPLVGALAPDMVGAPRQAAGSAAFRGFLTDAVTELRRDVVLILDHLEALPNDLVQALLTSLRAAYMEQQLQDHRLLVLASGALSLGTLAVGESSPFRGIARRVFLGSLSEKESQEFIEEQIQADPMPVSEAARRGLFASARGDPHLMWLIYRDSAQLARSQDRPWLEAEAVEQIAGLFLREEVHNYAPLRDAVRTIEEDPDLLQCLLLLLEREEVPLAQLPLPLSPDLDPLRMTGVVEKVGGDRYRLRNDIYRRFLTQHFNPGRVGRLFTAAGRWDSAIKHLEASAGPGSEQYRWDLLTAIINSMYASEDVNRAAHFLLRGLAAAFGIQEAQVWWAPIEVTNLRLAAQMGAPSDLAIGAEVPIREDRLEARAYRDKASLRGPETPPASPPQAGGERGGWRVERALPLLATRQQPVGVVVLQDELGERIAEQRERDLQLLSYLNQAARALEQVGRRTQELALAGRIQATLLPATPTLPGWELAATLRPARLTSGDFYDFLRLPGGKLGIAVADVADKGMGAALYMALSRTLIRTYAADYPDQPQHVMDATSSRMLADAGAELFVTAFYGVLDPISGRLTYSNAGHHPPYVIDAAGGAAPGRPQGATPLQRTGMALGVQSGETWQQQTVQLVPGDLLVLYTDGVCDAENGERDRFGPERLLEVLSGQAGKPAQEVLAALLAALHDFAGSEAQSDDITIVVVKRGAAVTAEELGVPRETVLRWRPRQTV